MNRVKSSQDARSGESSRLNDGTSTSTCHAKLNEHAPVRPTRPKSSSASMTSSRTNSFVTRFMGGTCGDPRRVTIQTNATEVSVVSNEDESATVFQEEMCQVYTVERPSVDAGVHREASTVASHPSSLHLVAAEAALLKEQSCRVQTQLLPNQVRNMLHSIAAEQHVDRVTFFFLVRDGNRQIDLVLATSNELPDAFTLHADASACTSGVPMTRSSKQHESESLAHSLKPTAFEQPITNHESVCNELSEEEMRVLEETLMKCG